MSLFADLAARGLIHQFTENPTTPVPELLEEPGLGVYCGFDPTARSLHVGNLIPLLGLRRFQLAGHRVIALAGGATGLIGDPSGKSEERNLLGEEALRANLAGIKAQLERLLDFSPGTGAVLVDNLDWTREVRLLDFMREIGKHFSINAMLRKDSVQNRIERDGAGISWTEFSYMLLQGFDFLHLYRSHDCRMQIGGSDQWGNITAGTELIRRLTGGHADGITFPLLTNSDGSKFGKTARGAVWLDPGLTSPFAFRQFWFRTSDADVVQRLNYFTFLPREEIAAIEGELGQRPNEAQRRLAVEMTALVHGRSEADKVERAVAVLFSPQGDLREIPAEYLADAFEGAPVCQLARGRLEGDGIALLDLVLEAVHGGGQNKGKARRDIEQDKAITLNGERWTDPAAAVRLEHLLHDRYLVLRKGKKTYTLVEVA